MSSDKTALVTGATGLLGREIVKAFERAGWTTVGTGLSRANPPKIRKLDLCDERAVEQLLDEVKPQVVVHSAAQRSPDICNTSPTEARALNETATHNLAQQTNARSILLLYISTDYVFPGPPGAAPYTASSEPAPTNFYGQTKLDGEKAVLDVTRDTGLGLVLRVPVLYGDVLERNGGKGNSESAVNVLMDAVWRAQEQDSEGKPKEVIMDDWAIRYPTNTEDVSRVCADIAELYTKESDEKRKTMPRTFQFSAEEAMTKYGMCQVLADVMGLPMGGMVANKKGNEPGGVQRPYDTHLTTDELKAVGVDVMAQDFKAWWYVAKASRRLSKVDAHGLAYFHGSQSQDQPVALQAGRKCDDYASELQENPKVPTCYGISANVIVHLALPTRPILSMAPHSPASVLEDGRLHVVYNKDPHEGHGLLEGSDMCIKRQGAHGKALVLAFGGWMDGIMGDLSGRKGTRKQQQNRKLV